MCIRDSNSAGHSRPSLWLVKEIFYPLTTPEAVTATYEGGEVLVGTVGSDEEMNTPLMLTDAAFWKVYQFRFLAGKPFTEADFHSQECGTPAFRRGRECHRKGYSG